MRREYGTNGRVRQSFRLFRYFRSFRILSFFLNQARTLSLQSIYL
jgi:hypothetical protein